MKAKVVAVLTLDYMYEEESDKKKTAVTHRHSLALGKQRTASIERARDGHVNGQG